MERFGSIDIGTNAILLLVAEIRDGALKPVFEKETIVRLGEGLQKNKIISRESMERGLKTLERYLQKCNDLSVKKIFAVGTSVLRESKNSSDFLKMVKERLGLSIKIISDQEEAGLSFLAVLKDLKEIKNPITVVDIGGGSTEFILGRGNGIIKWVSLPVGSVRFTEKFIHSNPVRSGEFEKMSERIRYWLKKIPNKPSPSLMVAVGGTATTLASVELGLKRFNSKSIHHFILTRKSLHSQLLLYRSRTVEDRKKIPGLPPSRADVILTGATILYLAMEELNFNSTMISCHGVRYGVLYQNLHPF